MDRSEVIRLVAYNQTQDSLGVWVKSPSATDVYCDVVSVSQTEWYEGSRNGLNPSLRFTVFRYDYNGEESLIYNDKQYRIYRTYVGRNETIDLYCEEVKGVPEVADPNPDI